MLVGQSSEVRVVIPRASVRAEPSSTAPILTSVQYGTAIETRAEQGDWMRVLVSDTRLGLQNARVDGWIPICAVRADVSCPSTKSRIAVAVDVPGKTLWLDPSPLRGVPILDEPGPIASVASSPNLSKALAGDTKLPEDGSTPITWVWTIPKAVVSRATALSARQPTFLAIYHDIPGLDPSAFAPAIVRVAAAGTAGVVALAPGRADAGTREVADWTIARDLKYDVVATTPLGGNVGMIKVRPAAPLPSGVYALALKPMYLIGYSGARVFGEEGIGLAIGEVWLFAVR